MDFVNILISLVSGIAGGNFTGAAMKEKSLGTLGNSITGLIGGGAGSYILQALGILASMGVSGSPDAAAVSNMDIGHIVGNIVGSGAGGALLTAIVAFIKEKMA
jgi:uncharacterized membrane protein YeaQ/YmgE (transglycosylase-associated protein family)